MTEERLDLFARRRWEIKPVKWKLLMDTRLPKWSELMNFVRL